VAAASTVACIGENAADVQPHRAVEDAHRTSDLYGVVLPRPTAGSVEDLVDGPYDGYDIIVVGVVSEVLRSGSLPMPPGVAVATADTIPSVGFTDFVIDVEQVFLDDGTIAENHLLIVRSGNDGQHVEGWRDPYPMEEVGDRYLYFLEAEIDGDFLSPGQKVYTGQWASASRLIIDEDDVMYSDSDHAVVPFATGTPPAAFLNAVATAVANRYPTPAP